jgi:hypothetical protein
VVKACGLSGAQGQDSADVSEKFLRLVIRTARAVSANLCRSLQHAYRMAAWHAAKNHRKFPTVAPVPDPVVLGRVHVPGGGIELDVDDWRYSYSYSLLCMYCTGLDARCLSFNSNE